jgi:hypothetical protein
VDKEVNRDLNLDFAGPNNTDSLNGNELAPLDLKSKIKTIFVQLENL